MLWKGDGHAERSEPYMQGTMYNATEYELHVGNLFVKVFLRRDLPCIDPSLVAYHEGINSALDQNNVQYLDDSPKIPPVLERSIDYVAR